MEILNKNAGLLSNSEVYLLLKETKIDLTKKIIRKKNLDPNNANLNQQVDKHLPTIVYESLRYLETTNCVVHTPKIVSEFLRKLGDQFELTKVEKLAILNNCPQSAVELQCLIEDSEERFSVEQMDALVEFIHNNLPVKNQQDELDGQMQTNDTDIDSK